MREQIYFKTLVTILLSSLLSLPLKAQDLVINNGAANAPLTGKLELTSIEVSGAGTLAEIDAADLKITESVKVKGGAKLIIKNASKVIIGQSLTISGTGSELTLEGHDVSCSVTKDIELNDGAKAAINQSTLTAANLGAAGTGTLLSSESGVINLGNALQFFAGARGSFTNATVGAAFCAFTSPAEHLLDGAVFTISGQMQLGATGAAVTITNASDISVKSIEIGETSTMNITASNIHMDEGGYIGAGITGTNNPRAGGMLNVKDSRITGTNWKVISIAGNNGKHPAIAPGYELTRETEFPAHARFENVAIEGCTDGVVDWNLFTPYGVIGGIDEEGEYTKGGVIESTNTTVNGKQLYSNGAHKQNGGAAGVHGFMDNHWEINARVYPNPATDVLNIEIDRYEGHPTAQLCDMTGRMLQYASVDDSRIFRFNTSQLAAGTYIVMITDNGRLLNSKQVIRQ